MSADLAYLRYMVHDPIWSAYPITAVYHQQPPFYSHFYPPDSSTVPID